MGRPTADCDGRTILTPVVDREGKVQLYLVDRATSPAKVWR